MKKNSIEIKSKDLINAICKELILADKHHDIQSIILTGSFGRDEPTYRYDNKKLTLKSDIEIILVYKNNKEKRNLKIIKKQITQKFQEDLNIMLISELRLKKKNNFNYSILSEKKKTLFTYDLYNGSKTIYGNDYLKKNVDVLDIDNYEAKRIIANRIGEYIYKNEHFDTFNNLQWKSKIILAIGSSWLIMNKKYSSSYRSQHTLINQNQEEIRKMLGNNFINDYNSSFEFLRNSGVAYNINENSIIEYLKIINLYFQENNIRRSKVNSVSRKIKYLLKYSKCGFKYGIFNFEDHILQALIDEFISQNSNITKTSKVWHSTLY